jgi:hypothetical protein
MNAAPHESRSKVSPMQFPLGHKKGECPLRLRLHSGGTFDLSKRCGVLWWCNTMAGVETGVSYVEYASRWVQVCVQKKPR